jgi:hypothetical protein
MKAVHPGPARRWHHPHLDHNAIRMGVQAIAGDGHQSMLLLGKGMRRSRAAVPSSITAPMGTRRPVPGPSEPAIGVRPAPADGSGHHPGAAGRTGASPPR